MNNHSLNTLGLLLLLLLGWIAPTARALDVRTIGIVADGPGFDRDDLIEEVTALSGADFEVRFPDGKIRDGGWTLTGVERALDDLVADPEVDLVVALGILASHVATGRPGFPKPVVATYLFASSVRDPLDGRPSGRRNLTWLAFPDTMDADLRALHELAPFRRVAVVVHGPFLYAIDGLPPLPSAEELGFEAAVVPVDGHPLSALSVLPEGTDAVYLTPLPAVPDQAIAELAQALIERKLPSFSMRGGSEVELGLLGSLADGNQTMRLTRRTAIAIQEILLGEDPAALPVVVDAPVQRLTVNLGTAEAIGLSLPPERLTTATTVGGPGTGTGRLGLREAVAEALSANPNLRATILGLDARDTDRARANSAWLPRVGTRAEVVVLDQPRVDASLGTQARRTGTLSVTVEQLLFSDAALAAVGAERDLAIAREAERDAAEIDLAWQVSLAWTGLQRAAALLEVHRNDHESVVHHFDVARSRRAVGQATAAEVARWEVELAQAQRGVVGARAGLRAAQLGLNLLLGRASRDAPPPMPIAAADLPTGFDEADLDVLLSSDRGVSDLVGARLIDTAIASAPDVRRLDAAISAQERVLGVARRSWAVPTVAATASAGRVNRDEPARLVLPGMPPRSFPAQPDRIWAVGVRADLPVFAGGARDADRREAVATLASLEHRRTFAEQAVEQQVLTAWSDAAASYAGLGLARDAADAAQRTVDWATRSYAEGLATQIQLLEARNAALNARLAWTDAAYLLLIDLLDLQQAVSMQHARLSPAAWDAFVADLTGAAHE
jgi:outer membrane protein